MIRVLVVDDEAPARRKLRDLLAQEEGVEVSAEAVDGNEAVDLIREHRPDLIFLDIQMPGRDGFGVIEEVGIDAVPALVFVTAYDEHALRAFEVHAFDYLVKPFAPSRFQRLMTRVRERLATSESSGLSADLQERLTDLLGELQQKPAYLQQIRVQRSPEREVLLSVEDVDLIRSQRNDLHIFADGESFRRRGTLSDLESRLDPERFLRINRSEIVRLGSVAELQPWFRGDYRVILKDGSQLTWSRRYRAKAKGWF